MRAYYNDFDVKTCAWLKGLMSRGLIMEGDIDNRPISEVQASELTGYTRHHFFSGIGGWDLAIRLANWSKDARVVSASLPCQPFSSAGKRLASKDERHLWPIFFSLISELKPPVIVGEQVERAIKFGWIDRIQADLEKEGYAVGYVVLGAHSCFAPHVRQRIFWGAYRMANDGGTGLEIGRGKFQNIGDKEASHAATELCRDTVILADNNSGRCKKFRKQELERLQCQSRELPNRYSNEGARSPWDSYEFIQCQDDKSRRIQVECGIQSVVDGIPFVLDNNGSPSALSMHPLAPKTAFKGSRTGLLRGYGNAIVPQVAAEFLRAFAASVRELEVIQNIQPQRKFKRQITEV